MRDMLLAMGVASERISIIPNWVDTNLVYPVKEKNAFRERHQLGSDFVVMYSGNLGMSQRLEHFLDAANLLKEEREIRFLLVGDGATKPELIAHADSLDLKNVTFLDYQPKSELAISLSAADLHFVVLDPTIAGCLMPSKIYGILAAGTPMLASTIDQCELARLVREGDVGYVVAFGDPEAIAERIHWSATHRDELAEMGERARQLAVDQYDRSYITRTFGELLLALTCDHRVSTADKS
jgi:glycosyltransferase involved in cell wall biosynthesis